MFKIRRWRIKALVMFCIIFFCLKLQMVESVSDEADNSVGRHSNGRRTASIKRVHRKETPKKRRVRFTVRLRLPSLNMSDSLADRSSDHYDRLSDQLTSDIERLFADTPGTQRVHNMRFSPYQSKDVIGEYTSKNKVPSEHKKPDTSKAIIQKSSHSAGSIAATETKTIPIPATLSPPSALDSSPSPSSSSSSWSSPARSENLDLSEETDIESEQTSLSSSASETPERASKPPSTKPSAVSLSAASLPDKPKEGFTNSADITTEEVTTTITMTKSSTEDDGNFNVQRLTRLFKECYATSGTRGDYVITMECYINAYMELMGIFQFMGPVFEWAGDDVRSKLSKLRELRKADLAANTNHYETMKNMFAYEYSADGKVNGVATNRWLHRALKFISGIIKAVAEPGKEQSMAEQARTIYGNTLAPHHDWFVRMGVYMALLSFPSRDSLLPQMNLSDSPQDKQKLLDLASVVDAIYDDVQKLYDQYGS